MAEAEDSMSIEELRAEVRRLWNAIDGLAGALRDLPEVLGDDARRCMRELGGLGGPDLSNVLGRVREIRKKHGRDAVPPVSEAEHAAVLWSVIRAALLVERDQYEVERAALPEASPHQGPIEPRTDC